MHLNFLSVLMDKNFPDIQGLMVTLKLSSFDNLFCFKYFYSTITKDAQVSWRIKAVALKALGNKLQSLFKN